MNFDKPPQENKEKLNKSSYEEILNEVEKNIDTPDEIKNFIEKRLHVLKNESSKVDIGSFSRQWHEGFIHPDSLIRRSYMVDPFCLDDDSIYEDMFSMIKKFKEHPWWKDKSMRQMMPFIIQHTIAEYFGNLTSYSNTEESNRKFYIEHNNLMMPAISISELKGKNIGVCAEKSAVSENLTSFLGLESYYIISNTCKANPDDNDAFHAYNIWKTENGYFIYDATNPSLNLEKDTNKILDYNPAIYPITEEIFNEIKIGETTRVKHTDRVSDSERNILETKVTERVYGGYKK
jgi:hypothetical protein